jgi:uncharacterized membrane protein required for colicin V production
VDIVETIRSLQPFDLLVILALMGLFVVGFMQGVVRRLLGIASLLFSFFLAAQVRAPLGGFLAENWTHLPADYDVMSGFLGTFLFVSLGLGILTQLFYRTVPLFEKYPVIDELLGGVLGVVWGVLALAVLTMILDSYFELPSAVVSLNEFPLVRELHGAIDASVIAGWYRDTFIPGFLTLFGLLVPEGVKVVFR